MNYFFSFIQLHQKMEELNYNQRRYINVINVNNGIPRDGKSVVMQMRQEIDQYKDQFHKVSRELKIQEGKNADLRSKNWKAMEALNNVERLYQKSLKTQATRKDNPLLQWIEWDIIEDNFKFKQKRKNHKKLFCRKFLEIFLK